MGNILTKNPVQKIALKEKGLSTLGGRKIWFDDAVFRLNVDGRGMFLGEFSADDKILVDHQERIISEIPDLTFQTILKIIY